MVPCFPLLGLTPSGLLKGLSSTLIYTSELILCSTIYNINRQSWPLSPYQLSSLSFEPVTLPVRLGNINSDITSNCNINRPSWPKSPYQLSSFEPVTLQARLGNINSDITSNYNINRPSWPTSPYQLSSFEPFTRPFRLGNINSDIT